MTWSQMRSKRGSTLIEVLAAIAVLAIGILALLRVFPAGFALTKNAENRTLAISLIRQEMEHWKNNATSLPKSVMPLFVDSAGDLIYQPNVHPDRMTLTNDEKAQLAALNIDPYWFEGANRFRRIYGEAARIPVPTPINYGLGTQQGGLYILMTGPVYYREYRNGGTLNGSNINVHGGAMRRLQFDTDERIPRIRNARDYAINYDTNDDSQYEDVSIYVFPVNYSRVYTINFDYYSAQTGKSRLYSANKSFEVGPNESGPISLDSVIGKDGKSVMEPGWEMRWGSEELSREFRQLDATAPQGSADADWSDDPYEFKILPVGDIATIATGIPVSAGDANDTANIGVILFNPLGRDYVERTARGAVPLTAYIDYDVMDWRVIREDRLVTGVPSDIKLTLGRIKTRGSFDENNVRYRGIVHGVSSPDFVAVNLTTGVTLQPRTPTNPNGDYEVDYRAGVVKMLSDSVVNANVRFYYQAEDDWGIQLIKPFDLYRERLSPSLSQREFYVGGSDGGVGNPTRIYFPITDASKSVSISEIHYVNGTGTIITLSDVPFQISPEPDNTGLCWVNVKAIAPDMDTFDFDSYGYAVRGVTGTSFKVRAIWYEDGRVRMRDLETMLVREAE
ncbi:MAG: type IV pilus modification PilV family protein [Armatimonadota bacterium]